MPTINKKSVKTTPQSSQRQERIKIYNTTRWRRLRAIKLSDTPYCERCRARGVVSPATEVHHVRSFMAVWGAERIALAYDIDNLESICRACHASEHAHEGKAPGERMGNM